MKRILLLILILSILASGCASQNDGASQVVEPGDNVSVNYVGELEDGTVFDTSIPQVAKDEGIYDSSRSYEPFSFVVGSGQTIQGFDEAVVGMSVGENKTVEIPPEDAYGERRDDLVIDIPAGQFESANITPVVGETIAIMGQPCIITNVSEENVTLDCNHKFAGETLIFTIEVVSIDSSSTNNS